MAKSQRATLGNPEMIQIRYRDIDDTRLKAAIRTQFKAQGNANPTPAAVNEVLKSIRSKYNDEVAFVPPEQSMPEGKKSAPKKAKASPAKKTAPKTTCKKK